MLIGFIPVALFALRVGEIVTKPSCHASGVTPPNMKIGLGWSSLEPYFRVKE
jgi:hypothetical protein